MSAKVLTYVVGVAVRVSYADRADARSILMLFLHVSKQTFTRKIRCLAERASVSASINVLLDLISWHYGSRYSSLVS